MSIVNWQHEFLRQRGLDSPTGEPLYSYMMSKEEFAHLEHTLTAHLQDRLINEKLGEIARDDPWFPTVFVFYGAEWWKRRFNGQHWSWTPILEDLGAPPDGWSQSRRSECIERGFRAWGLPLSFKGYHYLANIAFHGGLPMQLLAAAHGNIGRMLFRVIRTSSGYEDESVILDWIESLSSSLPQAYRREEIYVLLAEIARNIIEFKRLARLTTSVGAIEKLDNEVPRWRERLPISMDDEQAKRLIEQLVREIADTKSEQVASSRFCVARKIVEEERGTWRLSSSIDLNSYINAEALSAQFKLPENFKEQWLTLAIRRGISQKSLGLRKLAGQEKYRIDGNDPGSSGSFAASEHTLVLSTRDGRTYYSPVSIGDALENDSPWIFEIPSDHMQEGRFIRQDGGKIAAAEAIICIPAGSMIEPNLADQVEDLGMLADPSRKVMKIRGTVRVTDESGIVSAISCGEFEDEYQYSLMGNRIWDIFMSPEVAFAGAPRLERDDIENGSRSKATVTEWRRRAGDWQPTPLGLQGPIQARLNIHDEVRWHGRFVLLPADFKMEIVGDPRSASRGTITFTNSGIQSITVLTPGIEPIIEKSATSISARLVYPEAGSPPEFVELTLVWLRNPDSARVRVPFPAQGISIHAPDGKAHVSGMPVALSNLIGARIVAFSTVPGEGRLDLKLMIDNAPSKKFYASHRLVFHGDQRRLEIRLVDYMLDIQRMLSSGEKPDSCVRLSVSLPDGSSSYIDVSRYANRFEIFEKERKVGLPWFLLSNLQLESVENLGVYALRLNSTGSEPLLLEPIRTQGVHTGYWSFPVDTLEPGPWIIYPDAKSVFQFGPVLWPVETTRLKDLVNAKGSLAKALGTINPVLRTKEIADILELMTDDHSNEAWQLCEWIFHQIGHLQLPALDLWRGFRESPQEIAMLAFRMGAIPKSFVSRFPEELPFLFELVPLDAWVKAFRHCKEQAASLHPSEQEPVLELHVKTRIEELCLGSPAIMQLLRIARSLAFSSPENRTELAKSDNPYIRKIQKEQLFAGPECSYQHLLRRHNGDERWPTFLFQNEIEDAKNGECVEFLHFDQALYRNCVINLPIVLALVAMGRLDFGWKMEVELVSRIRQVQVFDPEWFDDAFSLTILRSVSLANLESRFQTEDN